MKKILILISILFVNIFIYAQGQTSRDWYLLDLGSDGIPGISVNKTYAELLTGMKSKPVVVAVIDSGVDYVHEDLKDIMWINDDEKPNNGKDDDGNGYIDDIFGWNFIGGKTGNNVDADNLEVARLYKSLQYKYSKANPDLLNKNQKKEYELFLEVKKEVEENRVKAAEAVDKINTRKEKLMSDLDAVDKKLKQAGLELSEVDSLSTDGDETLATGIDIIKKVMVYDPELKSIDDLKEIVADNFKRGLEGNIEKVKYHYNPDFDSRYIVGDNYDDPYEKYYGNNDVKGPDSFHGTHVSGIIAAKRDNGTGIDGIADNVRIMSIRVVPNGDERDKDVANGIRYAADNGASIINMSFGKNYSWNKEVVDKAVKYAQKKGVLLIHAAGNNAENNDEIVHYPSDKYEKAGFFAKKSAKNWIEVGASSYTNDSTFVAGFSNYGKKDVDIFAPGVAIYSTIPGNKYANAGGTSMATPVVAGVAAVLKSYFPGLSAGEIKDIILDSSVKKDMIVFRPGDNKEVNFSELSTTGGEVNLYNAVSLALKKYSNKTVK